MLRLEISCTEQAVVFSISFANNGSTAQQLPFPNRPRNAEFLGLIIEDQTGQRVRPDRKHIGRFGLSADDCGVWVQAGEQWTYNLVGKLENGELDFPATRFYLEPGRTYQIKFICKQVASNSVVLQTP